MQVQFTSREQETCLCPYCKACLHVGYRGPLSSSEKSAAKVEQQRIFEAILKARVVRLWLPCPTSCKAEVFRRASHLPGLTPAVCHRMKKSSLKSVPSTSRSSQLSHTLEISIWTFWVLAATPQRFCLSFVI